MNKNENLIISCTTDGFISNQPGMETASIDKDSIFSLLYYNMRLKLTGGGALLEKKYTDSKGVIS